MRLFFALELPQALREKIWDRSLEIQESRRSPSAKWVPRQNLHLTLVFLGETPPERLTLVEQAARNAAQGAQSFEAQMGGLGFFPSKSQARILWLGLSKGQDHFQNLGKLLAASLSQANLSFDPKEPKAHLTLARFKIPANMENLAMDQPRAWLDSWSVSDLVLYESRLSPEGPSYHCLGRVALG